jgi:hypothetical protein
MKVFSLLLQVCVAVLFAQPTRATETLVQRHSEKGLAIHCQDVPLEKVLEQIHTLIHLEIIVEEEAGLKKVTADIEGETIRKALETLLDEADVNYAMSVDPQDHQSLEKLFVGAGDPNAPVKRWSAPEEVDHPAPGGGMPPIDPSNSPAPPADEIPEMPPVDDDPYDSPAIDENTPVLMPPVGDPKATPASPATQANPGTKPKPKKKKN